MRVVGGRLKGRNLASPSSREIRPTADRLREAVFNILVHAYDDPIEGARVLDLFAGTGALGIEAVSRGAAFALFVDNGTKAKGSAILRAGKDREEGIGGVKDEGTIGGKESSMCCMGESGLPGCYVCGIAIQICGSLEREIGVEGWET